MKPLRIRPTLVVLALCAALGAAAARAHGGEDHGAPPPPPASGDGARSTSATTSAVEVVVRWPAQSAAQPLPITLLVSDWATNAPVEAAEIELTLAGASGEVATKAAATSSPGVYEAVAKLPADGTYALSATIVAGELVDVIALPGVEVGPAAPQDDAHGHEHEHEHGVGAVVWLGLGFALAAALVVGLLLVRRRRRAIATVSTAVLALVSARALAHGGEDHDHGPPAPAARASASSTVFFPKESQFLLGIRTEVVATRAVSDRLRVPGVVSVPPERHAAIFAPQPGRLVPPKGGLPQLGAQVRKGQVLGVVEAVLSAPERASFSAEEASARASIAAASARLDAAKKALARLQGLTGVVSKSQLEQAEVEVQAASAEVDAARARAAAFTKGGGASRFELVSPLDGVLADVDVSPGEIIDQGRRAFLVVDPAELTVEAKVYESDVGRLAEGADAIVTVDAYPGRTFPGRLLAQGQVVDEATRTVKVLFAVQNDDRLLKLGMFATVQIGGGGEDVALSVPDAAVLDVEGRRIVFVHTAPEEFTPKEVALGRRDGAYHEVKGGLQPGDRVVVTGAYSLKNAPAAAR